MTNKQPEALQYADFLDICNTKHDKKVSAELRRLHEVNQMLLRVLDKFEYSSCGFIKRHPDECEIIAAIEKAGEA